MAAKLSRQNSHDETAVTKLSRTKSSRQNHCEQNRPRGQPGSQITDGDDFVAIFTAEKLLSSSAGAFL